MNLMKEIVTFPKKPLQETTKRIIEAQATLKELIEKMNMTITSLPRTKLLCIRFFVCVSLSHVQFLSKVFIMFLANVPFQFPMSKSVNFLSP